MASKPQAEAPASGNGAITSPPPATPGEMSGADIVEKELPISIANVMLVCTHCQKPSKTSIRVIGDGSKARICKICEEVIE